MQFHGVYAVARKKKERLICKLYIDAQRSLQITIILKWLVWLVCVYICETCKIHARILANFRNARFCVIIIQYTEIAKNFQNARIYIKIVH